MVDSQNEIEQLMEKIVELKTNIEFQYAHFDNSAEARSLITVDLRELTSQYQELRDKYPDSYKQFIDKNPSYGFLNVLEAFVQDTEEGFYPVIKLITENTEQTVFNLISHFQTNDFYQWTKRLPTQKIKEHSATPQEQAMFLDLGKFSFPQIKREEMGDCLCLAFSGKLSENHHQIKEQPSLAAQTRYVRELMAKERVYVYWDFDSLLALDKTSEYKQRGGYNIYHPRGLAAPKILDSTYVDEKNSTLYVAICTNDDNTAKQGAQLFETYKTLQEAHQRGDLKIGWSNKNLKPSIMFFNQAFFCTQDENEVQVKVSAGRKGGTIEKEGYHQRSARKEFDSLLGDNKVSKDQMDKINGLVTLSILGNDDVSWPRFPHTFDICDIIYCNPITAGASTLWLHTKFEQLKIYEQPKRSEKMFNFLLDYCQEVIDTLNLLEPQDIQNNLLQNIKTSYERTLQGVINNFNSYNLKRDLNEEEKQKIGNLAQSIREFNHNQPNSKLNKSLVGALDSIQKGSFVQYGEEILQTQQFHEMRLEKNKQKIQKSLDEKLQKELKEDELKYALVTTDKEKFNDNLSKLDKLGIAIYSSNNTKKKVSLKEYIKQTAGLSWMMLQSGFSFSTTVGYLNKKEISASDYMEKDQSYEHLSFKTSVYSNFLTTNGSTRKNFIQKVNSSKLKKSDELRDADTLVMKFLSMLQTREGLKTIIDKGGLDNCVEKLVKDLEKLVKPENQNKPKNK